jgi:membrane protein
MARRSPFFTVSSLAPMLLVAIAVAGLAFGHEAAQGAIVAQLGGLAGGQTAAALEAMIASASNLGSGVIGIIIGLATFLFLATSAIIELQDDLNIIWKANPPSTFGISEFIRTRLLSLTLVVGFGGVADPRRWAQLGWDLPRSQLLGRHRDPANPE